MVITFKQLTKEISFSLFSEIFYKGSAAIA